MTREFLIGQIREKKSYLCVGLDTDPAKIPRHLTSKPDAIFQFNKEIIDATLDLCVAYKINTAFYEAMGTEGWEIMKRTAAYIPETHFKIADAKRGDIGNTADQYAKAFFEKMNFDAITVSPYMGRDSITPFLQYPGKWAIVLALTSNNGSNDFQQLTFDAKPLYQHVVEKVSGWGTPDNLFFVVGATRSEELSAIRKLVPDHFFLVPGVGFQGGNLDEVSRSAMNADVGILVNVSRAIIYAGDKENFATEARAIALQYVEEMKNYMSMSNPPTKLPN